MHVVSPSDVHTLGNCSCCHHNDFLVTRRYPRPFTSFGGGIMPGSQGEKETEVQDVEATWGSELLLSVANLLIGCCSMSTLLSAMTARGISGPHLQRAKFCSKCGAESTLARLWLPDAGGDRAWAVRTGSGQMRIHPIVECAGRGRKLTVVGRSVAWACSG
jgi:hypothetical protein